jgi:gamma-glutamyltranspeptidase
MQHVKDIRDAGGIITSEDISIYRPVLVRAPLRSNHVAFFPFHSRGDLFSSTHLLPHSKRDPLISKVNGHTVMGPGPPSSGGGAIIGALRFLSGYSAPYSSSFDTLSQHRYVEACRHVFAIRMSLSDPKFDRDTNANAVRDLIEGGYMETLRVATSDGAVLNMSQYGGPKWAQLNSAVEHSAGENSMKDAKEGDRRRRMFERIGANDDTIATSSRNLRLFNYLEDHGTTSLSVIDSNRNTVTITSSVNLEFGSKVVSPSTGMLLNNEMDDFSTPGRPNSFGLRPSETNLPVPGKRPLSSMSPTMVFRDGGGSGHGPVTPHDDLGDLVLSLGASGGPKIITAVLQTILNYVFVGMPLFESVSAPRIHDQLLYHGAVGTNVERCTLLQGPDIVLSSRTHTALERRGHELIETDYLGAVQAVAVDLENGSLTAVSDIRKQGMPAGY